MRTLSRLSLATLALWLSAAPARADVIVVDPGGGPGGALLQSAINHAHDGDILLLRAGDYTDADVTVLEKRLSLVADPPGASVTLRRLTLNLPSAAGETLVVRGLSIAATAVTTAAPDGLKVMGPVGNAPCTWLEDCTASASLQDVDGPGGLPHVPGAGIFCGLATPIVLVRCSATGAEGFDAVPGDIATRGGPGLLSLLSTAVVHECSFTGGAGGDGTGTATDGGPGVDSLVYISLMGCTLRGGDEGAGNGPEVKPGAGLHFSTWAYVRDVDAQPGSVVGEGTPSLPIVAEPGATLTTFSAPSRGLTVPSPLREGAVETLALRGAPGDGAWVWIGVGGGLKPVTAGQGAFVLTSPLPAPLFVGTITDPSGELDVGFHLPDLPPGMDGVHIFLQAVMAPAGGGLVTGSGSALLWLDAAL